MLYTYVTDQESKEFRSKLNTIEDGDIPVLLDEMNTLDNGNWVINKVTHTFRKWFRNYDKTFYFLYFRMNDKVQAVVVTLRGDESKSNILNYMRGYLDGRIVLSTLF